MAAMHATKILGIGLLDVFRLASAKTMQYGVFHSDSANADQKIAWISGQNNCDPTGTPQALQVTPTDGQTYQEDGNEIAEPLSCGGAQFDGGTLKNQFALPF
ncbi:hypothetical protein LTR56_025389 [Elasticomyces elasticus]|nr:hypothetical protein LTR56_025389 [Elasticomyces elasticus]KAK4904918.1 hypothetical protein LTR49_025712 [Elasticomyces elasticus]KAK5742397.1 hypothetical protein LTS12_024260 [Elasticomyces elasticus]